MNNVYKYKHALRMAAQYMSF